MKVLIVGIILLVVGIIIALLSFGGTLKDPSEEAKETLVFEYPDYSRTVNLDKGEYDIWYEEEEALWIDLGDPGDVTVRDSGGSVVYETSSRSSSESITVNDRNFRKKGSFEVDSSGQYTISVETSSTIYITEPIDVATGLGLCFGGAALGVVGGIIMLVGIILFFTHKKRAPMPPQYSTPQYSAPPPPQPMSSPPPSYQPPPPSAPGQYTCNYCHQPLRFMSEYQRWYCDYCRRYA